MSAKLHVGNLSHTIRDDELRRLFAAHGTVRTASVLDHLKTGISTASALVEMDSRQQADAAIAALNGHVYHGHALLVCWATVPQENARSRSRETESLSASEA